MALPGPGNPLSISQIRTELGSSSGSLRTLSSLAGKSIPDAISEFYGYSNGSVTITGTYYHSFTTTSQGGGGTITVTGSSARFFARAVCLDNAAGVAVSVSASSFNSYITRSNSTGTSDGTIFTLQPGTYSYSYSVVKQFGYAIGGGLVFIQP